MRLAAWLCCCLLLSAGARGALELPPGSRLNLRTWSMDDGMPVGSVTAIAQSEDGALWTGTFGGLARFDGATFRVHDLGTTRAIPFNRVTALALDENGGIWCGGQHGGICHLPAEGEVRSWHLPQPHPISALHFSRDGRLFIGAYEGLYTMTPHASGDMGRPEIVPTLATSLITSLCSDSDGDVWCGADDTVCRIGPDLVAHRVDLGLPDQADRRPWICTDSAKQRVTVLQGDWLLVRSEGQWRRLRLFRGRPGGFRWAGEMSSGDLVVAQRALVTQVTGMREWLEGGEPPQLVPLLAESYGEVRTAAIDNRDQVWVGTSGQGLGRVSLAPVRRLIFPDVLDGRDTHALLALPTGEIWVSVNGAVLMRSDGVLLERLRTEEVGVRALAVDEAGAVLGGQQGRVLRWLHGEATVLVDAGSALDWVNDLLPVGPDLWIASQTGLWLWSADKLTHIDLPDLSNDAVHVLLLDRDGAVWAASARHIYRVTGPDPRRFLGEQHWPLGEIRTMVQRPDGAIWAGTYGSGLVIIRPDGNVRRVTAAEGLPENIVSEILIDESRDRAWLLGNRGAYRLALRHLTDFIDGATAMRPRYRAFLSQDGMDEGNRGSPAGVLLEDGSVVFGTISGPRRIMCGDASRDLIHVPIVDRAWIDGREVDPGEGELVVHHGDLRLELHLAATNLQAPESTWVEGRLVGLDKSWQRIGDQRMASYMSLPVGDYQFEARAAVGDGEWVLMSQPLRIRRVPTWHETAALPVLLVLTVAGVVGLVAMFVRRHHRARLRQMEERIATQEAARERERRLVDELNHRVRNNLASVISLIELSGGTSGTPGREAVPRIYTMSRVHAILSKRQWSVVALSEIIDDVVRSEQPDRMAALMLTGEIDTQIEPGRCQALAMTLHELAVNARQHGAWSVPDGRIRIDVRRDENALTIDWIEEGVDHIQPPTRRGMGLTLVTGFVEHDLNGRVIRSFDPPGFRAMLVLPLEQPAFMGAANGPAARR